MVLLDVEGMLDFAIFVAFFCITPLSEIQGYYPLYLSYRNSRLIAATTQAPTSSNVSNDMGESNMSPKKSTFESLGVFKWKRFLYEFLGTRDFCRKLAIL